MVFIYNILTVVFLPAIIIYWLAKVVWRRTYLAGLTERLGRQRPRPGDVISGMNGGLPPLPPEFSDELCFWVHAVSAGEVMGAVPIIRGLQTRFPSARIVLSTLTPTGRQVALQHCDKINVVMYGPVDFFLIVDRVISHIRPTIFLPVETDIWPTLIQRLSRRGVPCVLVNGRVSHRRVRYRFLFKAVFRQMTFFSVQTEVDAERLGKLGVSRSKVAITGNTKFSQAARSAVDAAAKRIALPDHAHLLIGGSTHENEEAELLRCYARLAVRRKNIFLLLAPRHLERLERVERLVTSQGFAHVRWSCLRGEAGAPIIILDTMGQLPQVYAQATIVFVGGSWVERGGHNVMEPAAWVKPIFFGPHMDNYSSIAATLLRLGAAAEVQNGEQLANQVDNLLGQPEKLAAMGRIAKAFVENNQDAVKRNLQVIENVLAATRKLTPDAAGISELCDHSPRVVRPEL